MMEVEFQILKMSKSCLLETMVQRVVNTKPTLWIKTVWTMLQQHFQRQQRIIFQNSTLIIQVEVEISKMGSWMPLEHPKIRAHTDMKASANKITSQWLWHKVVASKIWFIMSILDRVLKSKEASLVEQQDHKLFQACNSISKWPTQTIQVQQKRMGIFKIWHKHLELM